MSDEIGKITYRVDVSTEDAQKALGEFKDDTKEVAQELKNTEEASNKSFDGINAKAVAVATAVGMAVAKMAKDIVSATSEIEAGRANIVNATGATGESLENLMASAKTVFSNADESFDEVSRAIGEINTRLGLTGTALEETTDLMLAFSGVTGQDVQQSVIGVTQAMNQWGLSTEDMPLLLDKLTVAGQASGVSVQSLTTNLTDNAGTLRAMGYSLDEAISMLMSFEKQGIDSNAVLMGMKQSFAQSAKAGTDARQDWESLITSISGATDETTANSLAVDTFGNRVATTLVTALRDGKLNFDEFTGAIADSEGALIATDEAGKTTADRFGELKNQTTVLLAELGEQLAPVLLDVVKELKEFIPTIGDIFTAMTPVFEAVAKLAGTLLPVVVDTLNLIAPIIETILKVATDLIDFAVGGITQVIEGIGKFIKWFTGEQNDVIEAVEDANKGIIKDTEKTTNKVSRIEQTSVKQTENAKTRAREKAQQKAEAIYLQEEKTFVKAEGVKTEAVKANSAEQTNVVLVENKKKQEIIATTVKVEKEATEALERFKYDSSQRQLTTYQLTEEQKLASAKARRKLEIENEEEHASRLEDIYNGMSMNIGTAIKNMFADIEKNGKVSTESLQDFVSSAMGMMGEAVAEMGRTVVEGGNAWESLGKSALKALSAILKALAEEMTARAVLALFTLDFVGAGLLTAGATATYFASGLVDGWANSLAVGKDYVPYDGYPAKLHRGEMVLTRSEADSFRDLGGNYGIERGLNPIVATNSGSLLNSFNINNQLHAVIEVDGTQLGVAVLKNIDNARPFVMG